MHTQARVTVALVWPLNAAIHGTLDSARTRPIAQLLQGLPVRLVGDYASYQAVIATRVRWPFSSTCKLSVLTLICPLQSVFLDMFRTLLATEQAKIAGARSKETGAKDLLRFLRDNLHLDDDKLSRTMEDLSRLDIEVEEADQGYLQALQVPSLSVLTEPLPITTYAVLLWRALMQVSLAVSVKHTNLFVLKKRRGRLQSGRIIPTRRKHAFRWPIVQRHRPSTASSVQSRSSCPVGRGLRGVETKRSPTLSPHF